ncbi:hypothetical protein MKX01_001637, partial [Papaver californicum]
MRRATLSSSVGVQKKKSELTSRQLNQLYGGAAHSDELGTGLLFGCTTAARLYNDKINTDDKYEYKKTLKKLQVYTLGSSCGWRTKGTPFPWVDFTTPASFADGSMCWFNKLSINAFDLANEELRMVPSPPPCQTLLALGYSSMVDNFGLVVLRGSLCFFHQTFGAPSMEIWSLKKTDMSESWCKDFSIVFEMQKEGSNDEPFWPIIITENGKIIFMKDYCDRTI